MKKLKLNLELDTILPGKPFKIGTETVMIRPLMFGQYSDTTKQIRLFIEQLQEKNITLDNYEENWLELVECLLIDFPPIIEEASGIDIESLRMLPIDTMLGLLDVIVEVNMASKDTFLGNFSSLSTRIQMIFSQKKPPVKRPRKTTKSK